ncbi:MAG TPA: lytic murein transglycosylase [Baekduia sp.]|nr:lytic murein transglycosylase [Baekduia sp.]
MRCRLLLTCLAIACLALAGLGGLANPAAAQQLTYTAVMLDGSRQALTLEVPTGTPIDELQLPAEIADQIYSLSDGTTTVLAADLARIPPPVTSPAGPAAPPVVPITPDPSPGTGEKIEKSHSKAEPKRLGNGRRISKPGQRKRHRDPDKKNPTYSYALPGPAPIGVPNFFIDRFRIPPFLLSIYQAAGIEYGVPWEVLAAINEIETDYGRNLNVSTAGARGWMQFMPATWKQYGVDANNDGTEDPYNPVDAIFSAARYLRAADAATDLKKAIFAYNHADWYVDSVILRAKVIAAMPVDLVGSLTGLTQGRFPVESLPGRSREPLARERGPGRGALPTYEGAIDPSDAGQRLKPGENAARPVESETRNSMQIDAAAGSNVIAVQDGKIVAIGESKRLGRFIRLRDLYGNTYTYAQLGTIARTHEVRTEDDADSAALAPPSAPQALEEFKVPSLALPVATTAPTTPYTGSSEEPLKEGSHVTAGTVLGTVGQERDAEPKLQFAIRPAGKGAPQIDPKPILDGWRLLETTAIYRAEDAKESSEADQLTIGQILLMSKDALTKRVLTDPRIEIYECGRRDIEAGIIDRRVLATISLLANSGLQPTISSLRCGHSRLTTSGNVSYHSMGGAIDIAAINGIPILGHQGPGSITDQTVRKLLTLQGNMKPDEIISLAQYGGTDNTYAMGDHDDHIHVGFRPLADSDAAKTLDATIKPSQWNRLIERLGKIENPTVDPHPSDFSISATAPAKKSDDESGHHHSD